MKHISVNDKAKIKGFYVNEVIRGFWGEQGEGRKMLKLMGLDQRVIPFSIAILLQKRRVWWRDREGRVASVYFRLKPNQIECFGYYLGTTKSSRVFREWANNDETEMIERLHAIGDLCMKCIYEKLIE